MYPKTFNPCDECRYSYSKLNQESEMCKICEFNQLQAENAALKARLEKAVELVDLAVSDLNGVYGSESCDFCENFSFCDDHDQSYCDGINFKWQHQAKLEEMKGGAK